MQRAQKIEQKLAEAFSPVVLDVINESEMHRGHAGYTDGETHYRVRMVDASFADQSRLARHRAVHAALGAELVAEIHALALELSAPE